jgi:ABC-type multidrug transport system fused ATPase/permease subunit
MVDDHRPYAAGALSWSTQLRSLKPALAGYAWTAPVLLALGLAASLAEAIGVSVVVLFFFSAARGGAEAAQSWGGGGGLSHVFAWAGKLAGGDPVALGSLIFLLIAAKSALALAYDWLSSAVRYKISERIQVMLHARYLDAPYEEIQQRDRGELMTILHFETWQVADAYNLLARMAVNLCTVAVFGAVLVSTSWKIAATAATGSVLLFWGMRLLTSPSRRLGDSLALANSDLAARVLTALQAMRTVRAYTQEEREKLSFRVQADRVRRLALRIENLWQLVPPATEIGYLALLAAIFALSSASAVPFAAAVACVALLYRLQPHIREFEGNRVKLAGLLAPVRRVCAMLGVAADARLPSAGVPFAGLAAEVRFDHVGFTYRGAGKPSLVELSFVLRRGTTTALIGPSGSGKTTIVNLLLRLIRPDTGAITVDGVPLEVLEPASWLAKVAVAGQDMELIEGTIAENLRVARPHASDDDLRTVAAQAGLLAFIEGLPRGFDTRVGEQGYGLSGGQRQRVGLARALLRDADLVIFDEATNGLDVALTQEIRRNMQSRLAGKTVLVITHSQASLTSVDNVLCLANGKVVDQGTPSELLARSHNVQTAHLLAGEGGQRKPGAPLVDVADTS